MHYLFCTLYLNPGIFQILYKQLNTSDISLQCSTVFYTRTHHVGDSLCQCDVVVNNLLLIGQLAQFDIIACNQETYLVPVLDSIQSREFRTDLRHLHGTFDCPSGEYHLIDFKLEIVSERGNVYPETVSEVPVHNVAVTVVTCRD